MIFKDFFTSTDQNLNLRSIVSIEELYNHDMIYVYHHLKIGDQVNLIECGTNIKGDIRFKVAYKNFTLGFVTIGGLFKDYFESSKTLFGTINAISKKKFMPISALDIELYQIQLKNVC